MTDILQRIYDADFAMKDSVADVMEDWDGARLVADGRAPSLWEWNHAALLRSDPDNADALIERIAAAAGCTMTMTFDQGAAKAAGMTLVS